MSMSREELKAAFREGYSHDFDNIPSCEAEITIDISTRFENKMEALIRKENKSTWHWLITSYKKVIALVATLVLMLTMTFSVSAIRTPIVEFFTNVYETFIEFLFNGDTSDIISTHYKFKETPNGFKIIDSYEDKTTLQTTYKNENGDIIELSQTITDDTNYSLDSEQGEIKIVTVEGNKINLYLKNEFAQAIWIEGNTLMTLAYEGDIDEEKIVELIGLIEPQKEY